MLAQLSPGTHGGTGHAVAGRAPPIDEVAEGVGRTAADDETVGGLPSNQRCRAVRHRFRRAAEHRARRGGFQRTTAREVRSRALRLMASVVLRKLFCPRSPMSGKGASSGWRAKS